MKWPILLATPVFFSACGGSNTSAKNASSPCIVQLVATINTTDKNKQDLTADLTAIMGGSSPLDIGWKSSYEAHVNVTFQTTSDKNDTCAILARATTCAIQEHAPESVQNNMIDAVKVGCNK